MESSINPQINQAVGGMNLTSQLSKMAPGQVTYALNAVVENMDGQSVSYQNEGGNELCCQFPKGYQVIGLKYIEHQERTIAWLYNEQSEDSEIGIIENCTYTKVINAKCLNFSLQHPIHKAQVQVDKGQTQVFWTDGYNPRRYLNLDDLPYKKIRNIKSACGYILSDEVDCNRMLVQPNFKIPELSVKTVESAGELKAGTYQFSVAYANEQGEAYTSYYSVSNPLPAYDVSKVTLEHDYPVNLSVDIRISNLDPNFEYVKLAVVRTVNNISKFELAGTYRIDAEEKTITYTGQRVEDLAEGDIFEKFPSYIKAEDSYTVQGVLGWAALTEQERVSYQEIASQIPIQWQSYRLKAGAYRDPLHVVHHKGYMRDEVYPLEFVPLLKGGRQCDGFTIPGRPATAHDLEYVGSLDTQVGDCEDKPEGTPRWKIYNTANLQGYAPEYVDDACYEGPYQYGEMAFWESTEAYDCEQTPWLHGPIRHHKTPDEGLCPRYSAGEEGEYIYPIGLKIDVDQVLSLIQNSSLTQAEKDQIQGFKIVRGNRASNKSIQARGLVHNVGQYEEEGTTYLFPNYPYNDLNRDVFIGDTQTKNDEDSDDTEGRRLNAFRQESKSRFTFHSPDTHFYKPSLGNILQVETVEEGVSKGHFVPVKDHAKYSLLSTASYVTALSAGVSIGVASMEIGLGSNKLFDGTAAFTAFQTIIGIIEKVIPRVNYAYQFNSIGKYNKATPVAPSGNKVRRLDIARYIVPGMEASGEQYTINNFQRESAVYLKTADPLPFSHEQHGSPDNSRWILSQMDCKTHVVRERHLSTYYCTVKKEFPNQWGQLYTYETIDTGFQWTEGMPAGVQTIFGGDAFIGRFAYKTKLPFFLDHRVGAADNADIFYNELGNVAHPLYWLSTDAIRDVSRPDLLDFIFPIKFVVEKIAQNLFGVKANNFDCRTNKFFYQAGKFYLFAYGIPYFFAESEVNVDMRGAFNSREGDYYPRMGEGIPDEWLQEVNTSIQHDNSYHYNKTYSKQNKENYFSHLPADYDPARDSVHPFRTIYSDRNNWFVYRANSKFDLEQAHGPLNSVEALNDGAVLVRYHNKSQLYNVQLKLSAENGLVAYAGNDSLFKAAPPLDLGFGSQHKMFLHTPYGFVTTDARKGTVFLLAGTQPKDLTTLEVAKFFQQYLDTIGDNPFQDTGLTGTYDPLNKRMIITKLGDKPFSISYNFLTQSWISFHSYQPRYYLANSKTIFSGNGTDLWMHGNTLTLNNHFYGEQHSYVLEYPFSYKFNDEILQSIRDYSEVRKYDTHGDYILSEAYFNKAILSNEKHCSGMLNLYQRPKKSLKEARLFPRYKDDSKDIVYTIANSFYNYNTFWGLNDPSKPIWKYSDNLSLYKELNQPAMDYSKRSHKKVPIEAKNLKVRHILDDRSDIKIISQFIVQQSQITYK